MTAFILAALMTSSLGEVPTSAPSKSPGISLVHVIFHSNAPRTELVLLARDSTTSSEPSDGRLLGVAPLELDLDLRDVTLFVRGPDLVPTKPFSLSERSGAVRLDVRRGSPALLYAGLTSGFGGAALALLAFVVIGTGVVALPVAFWLVTISGGLLLSVSGLVMCARAQTQVTVNDEVWPRPRASGQL